MPRKLVSFDWAIKRILRSKANFEVLESESNQDQASQPLLLDQNLSGFL